MVCWHLPQHCLLRRLQAQEGLRYTGDMQQGQGTTDCSPSPHSKATPTSCKWFSLLAVSSLSHTSILWLRNSSRWCSAVPPGSTLYLLTLLKVFCLILAPALSVLNVWPLVGRQHISAFPPVFSCWDPSAWLLATTSLACGGKACHQPLRQPLPVNASAGTKAQGLHWAFWAAEHSYARSLWWC